MLLTLLCLLSADIAHCTNCLNQLIQIAQLNTAQSADDKLHNFAIWKDLQIVQIGRLRGNSTLVVKPKAMESKCLEMFLF